ncbi:MAG TPA: NAD(P)-dependent oxidoreductase [Nevskiaceae bacterium]
MRERAFVAGASGVIGRALCRLMVADGWQVFGTTRSAEKVQVLRELGVEPVVVDVYDAAKLRLAVCDARPSAVVHQLTALPDGLDPKQMAAALERNARIRIEGTRNLVAATVAARAPRLIAQSLAFVYAPGPRPYHEEAPLAVDDAAYGETARAVASLEAQVLEAPLKGIVLRYGKLYGPGTGFDAAPAGGPVHVEDAALAAYKALRCGAAGVYNIAENDGTVAIDKAAKLLGWTPTWRNGRRVST